MLFICWFAFFLKWRFFKYIKASLIHLLHHTVYKKKKRSFRLYWISLNCFRIGSVGRPVHWWTWTRVLLVITESELIHFSHPSEKRSFVLIISKWNWRGRLLIIMWFLPEFLLNNIFSVPLILDWTKLLTFIESHIPELVWQCWRSMERPRKIYREYQTCWKPQWATMSLLECNSTISLIAKWTVCNQQWKWRVEMKF